MTNSGKATAVALRIALKMEDDGLEMYTKAAEKTANPMGKRMFLSLAEDERGHKRMIEAVAKGMGMDEALKAARSAAPRERIRTVFSEARDETVEKVAVSTDDTGVLRIGMDFESRSNVYYVRAAQGATDEDEKALFERLAFEEGEHYKILQDLRDYLEQTGWWLLWGEGAFMDGF